MQSDRQGLGQGGDLEGQIVGDGQEAVADTRIGDQHLVGEGALGPAAADEAAGLHRVDDHPLADGHTLHGLADRDHLARGLMADRRDAAFAPVDAAHLDIGQVAAADAAGLDLHDDIVLACFRRIARIQTNVAHAMNVQNPHRTVSLFRSDASDAVGRIDHATAIDHDRVPREE